MSVEKILSEDSTQYSSASTRSEEDSDSTPESATDSLNSLYNIKTTDNTCAENCMDVKMKCEGEKKKGICCSKFFFHFHIIKNMYTLHCKVQ